MSIPMMSYGLGALRSIDSMRQNGNLARRAMDRLASGLQINSAEDDPSGNALARGHFMNRLGRIQAGIENLEMGIKYMDLRLEGLNSTKEKILRMMDIAVRAANEATLTPTDLLNLQTEIDGLNEAIADNQHMAFRINNGDTSVKTLYNPGQLDVVWVMDQTGSMDPYINQVKNAAPLMFSTLNDKGFDLRMGAVGFHSGGPVALNPLLVPPGTPFSALSPESTKTLYNTMIPFRDDVADIGDNTGGTGAERGLDATLEAIYATGIDAQLAARPNAQRVFILLSDADSDDNGDVGKNIGINTTNAQRDLVVNTLNDRNIKYYVVNSVREGAVPAGDLGQDADYTDISTRTGGGAMDLDGANAWVNTISNTLQAFGGPWDLRFHWGPDSDNHAEYTVDTIMPTTLGVNGVNVTTAANAANSIDTINKGMEFLNQAFVHSGAIRSELERTLNTQMAEYTEVAAMTSHLVDADIAVEIARFAKASITQDAAVATLSHTFQSIKNLMTLIDQNLTGSVPSGSGPTAQSPAPVGLGATSGSLSDTSST